MKKPDYFARQLGGNERLTTLKDKLSDRDRKSRYRYASNEARKDRPGLRRVYWGINFTRPVNPDIDTVN